MNRNATSIDLHFDDETNTYRLQPGGYDSIGTEVVLAIADLTDSDPLELEPLASYVNADLLDRLFRPEWQSGEVVAFDYLGYHVTVEQTGTVTFRPNATYFVWVEENAIVGAMWSS